MRRAISPVVVALVAVLVAGVGGCSDALYNTCADDSVCGAGTVCAFGLCVDANDARLAAVDIEVEPVESSGLPQQTSFDVDTQSDAGDRITLTLTNAAQVAGTVKSANVNDEGIVTSTTAVAATVRALPERSIAGRVRVPSATTDENGSFAFNLLNGADYTLSIVPDDPRYPPLEIAAVDERDVDGASFVVNDGEDQTPFVHLHGVVVNASGPLAAMEVLVLGASGRRISTRVVTGDDGAFDLVLRSLPPGAQLVVRPASGLPPDQQNLFQPTVVIAVDPVVGDVDLGEISLGNFTVTRPLAGTVTSSSGPVAGATVSFTALIGGGVFAVRVPTDESGAFQATLLPGSYSVAAVPPVTGRAGLLVLPELVDIPAAGVVDDLAIDLPARVAADVNVTSSDGVVVASASVSFERVGDVDGLAQPVLENAQPAFLAATDVDGNASVVVDRGRYRVKITPPRESGAPGFSTLISIDGPLTRAFVLPPSNVLAGVVVDGRGVAAPGAFVRVFSQLTDEQGRAIPLGEAISGDDGAFAVSVPDLSP